MVQGVHTLAFVLVGGCGRIAFDARADANGADSGASPADVTAGDPSLLLWFSFETGVTTDSATQHDATCTSCPTITAGPRGGSAGAFDGSNCLTIDVPTSFHPPVLTFAAWMRMDDGRDMTFFGSPYMSDVEVTNAFEIFTIDPGVLRVLLNTATGSTLNAPQGEWHHAAGTYDGTMFRIYLDGALSATVASGPPVYSDDMYRIGCDRDAGVELAHVFGAIDEVRLYNRALSDAEIAALAQ